MNTVTIQTKRAPDDLPRRMAQPIILSALLTGLFLGGSLSFPFWYGLIYYYASAPVKAQLATYLSPDSLPAIWHPGVVVGAIIWGVSLAHISGIRPLWRLGLAGGVGVFLGQLLWTFPAIDLQDALWPTVPPHIRFAREFVVGVGVAAGITTLILGLAIRPERAVLWLALTAALAAAVPALIVDLGLDLMGIRWGAGNANMAKVVGLGFPAASLSAGAAIGWYLARFSQQR